MLLIAIIPAGCGGSPGISQSPEATGPGLSKPDRSLRGVSISPRSMEPADFAAFFDLVSSSLDVIMWAGDWKELGQEHGGPRTVMELAGQYPYLPLVEASVHHDGEPVHPLEGPGGEDFKQRAAAYAERYQPEYLGLGIEINTLWETHPDVFQTFAFLFNETRAAVKNVSPETRVFTCFQLEKIKGYTFWQEGSLDPNHAQWGLIDLFDADLIAFTTYPGLVFKRPGEIPEDYYTSIRDHVSQPVIFTEIGWHTEAYPPGWESSDDEQAAFLSRFMELAAPLECEILIWSFLYDGEILKPFDSMGLMRSDNSARPAWDIWRVP